MEMMVDQWFRDMRKIDACIDGNTIRAKAREIYHEIHPIGPVNEGGNSRCQFPNFPFVASQGWLWNFCKRKLLSFRRISTTGRELPADTLSRINDFYVQVSKIFFFQ